MRELYRVAVSHMLPDYTVGFGGERERESERETERESTRVVFVFVFYAIASPHLASLSADLIQSQKAGLL